MAISKNGLTILALLVTLVILETGILIEFACRLSPGHEKEEAFLPHTRQKRNVLTEEWSYIIDVVVNASNADEFEQLQSSLNTTGFPIQLDNNTQISNISITTVCSSTSKGFQCRCNDGFAWSHSICSTYETCDYTSDGICKCINGIPAKDQSCQPISVLLNQVEYDVVVELNVTDVWTVDRLRSLLDNSSFYLSAVPNVNITNINITTVCYPNGSDFQCRCEDQFVWSKTNCITYGACDDVIGDMCRCIRGIPSNGQYCQPKPVTAVQLYKYILEVEILINNIAVLEQLKDNLGNISFPVTLNDTVNITQIDIIFTVPIIYEYQIFIEVNATDVDKLRNALKNVTFPVQISSQTNISSADITTVCSEDATGLQCRCEHDFLWPCDKCATYGHCDGGINNTCSCIKALPADGQYCQAIQRQGLIVCPLTTTVPPVVYEYLISIEIIITNVTVTDQLRDLLNNISYPISISNHIQIYNVNISTVCAPQSGGFQCSCEDQYRWSCDQCLTYGSCDNITDGTCGCLHTIPPDGQYCQPVGQHNFTACPPSPSPSPTTPPVVYEYLVTVELNTTDVIVIERLRNISYPINISNNTQVSGINISTVCYPISGSYQCRCEDQYRWSCDQCLTYGSCDNITDGTCGCLHTIPPDGQYCQPVGQHNFTACPFTTTTTPQPTTPTVHYEYIVSVELNVSDAALINQLRTTLSTISYPIRIDDRLQIPNINISTICFPNGTSYQCRCEEAFQWPCHMCSTFGKCGDTFDNSCRCINTIPPDGSYCQLTDLSVCPSPTPPNATATTVTTTQHTTKLTTATTITDSTPFTSTDLTTNTALPPIVTNSTQLTTTTMNTTITPTTTGRSFNLEMSIRLDKEFTAELNDPTSSVYQNLKNDIESVLQNEYKEIQGFIRVFVTGFRPGSIITDFVVETTQFVPSQIDQANKNLPDALSSVAPVIGSVSAFYQSPKSISIPDLTYTGNSMVLRCSAADDINIGTIADSVWRFNGVKINPGRRFQITTSDKESELKINNVIPADSGLYNCTLKGQAMDFLQSGVVTSDKIKQAPIIRLKGEINVRCIDTVTQPLTCCVQKPYTVQWFRGTQSLPSSPTNNGNENCITYNYQLENCIESVAKEKVVSFECKVDKPSAYAMTTTITFFTEAPTCNNAQFGIGQSGDKSSTSCQEGQVGNITAVCEETGTWKLVKNTCVVKPIKDLLVQSQGLVEENVAPFVKNLSRIIQQNRTEIANSSATISAVVDIINNVANVTTAVNESVMQNLLDSVDAIIGEDSRESWEFLNANTTTNASSELLGSLETLSGELVGDFTISTQRILLNRTTFSNSFRADLNSSVVINIPNTNYDNISITTIIFSTLFNVMPTRNSSFNVSELNESNNETVSENAINAPVVLVTVNATIQNVTLSYDKLNNSLKQDPQCVFWNFTLFDDLGAWDNAGCEFVSDINNTVTCNCNHLTSFSILMATNIPPQLREALDVITYVGVGISLASLLICLIIEAYVWKPITRNSTAFMRHVSIVNTALSLLIADICFLIGASIATNPEDSGERFRIPIGPCSTATFFMHFFYLALFFWMLVSGLLLFYRTVMVFSHMSKSTMLAIGFCLGYGCPLIIAVITVAVTAGGEGYIKKYDACWLNWTETKALLAMVIPALTIVFINMLIVIVVLFKMLRRGVGDSSQTDEKHTLVVIARCLVILTPLFGLTWSLGVGTMISSTNKGIHIAFAFFNSLQGFFILVFGTLFDSKIRSILSRRVPTQTSGSNTTRSTSGGVSSFSAMIGRLRGRRYIYNVSQAANSNSSGASESFVQF